MWLRLQSKVCRPRCDESRNHGDLGKAGISSFIADASDRNHGEINQWFGREDDGKVTAKAWGFLEGLSN